MREGWLGLLIIAACGSNDAGGATPLREPSSKSSYAVGFEVGMDLKRREVSVDPAVACNGLQDALRGDAPRVGDAERKKLVTELKTAARSRDATERKEIAGKNADAGKKFRDEHRDKPGVVALPSGLQYKPVVVGMGAMPTIADTAVCHYRLTTIDGAEIEDTRANGRPAELAVKRMVKGVSEALQRMPVGSTWELVVPPELAYGTRGAPRSKIGPNQTLVFTIELLSIKPATSEEHTADR